MGRTVWTVTSVLVLISAVHAQQDWCDLVPTPKVKKVVYCESLPIGTTQGGGYTISLESKFFDGLRRTIADGRVRFQKDGQDVSAYPGAFLVAVEKRSLVITSSSGIVILSGTSTRTDQPTTPRKVRLRWLDSSGVSSREITADLEEVQEAWPELSFPRIWYRAKIEGVSEPLNAELEVNLIDEKGNVLGQVKRFL